LGQSKAGPSNTRQMQNTSHLQKPGRSNAAHRSSTGLGMKPCPGTITRSEVSGSMKWQRLSKKRLDTSDTATRMAYTRYTGKSSWARAEGWIKQTRVHAGSHPKSNTGGAASARNKKKTSDDTFGVAHCTKQLKKKCYREKAGGGERKEGRRGLEKGLPKGAVFRSTTKRHSLATRVNLKGYKERDWDGDTGGWGVMWGGEGEPTKNFNENVSHMRAAIGSSMYSKYLKNGSIKCEKPASREEGAKKGSGP